MNFSGLPQRSNSNLTFSHLSQLLPPGNTNKEFFKLRGCLPLAFFLSFHHFSSLFLLFSPSLLSEMPPTAAAPPASRSRPPTGNCDGDGCGVLSFLAFRSAANHRLDALYDATCLYSASLSRAERRMDRRGWSFRNNHPAVSEDSSPFRSSSSSLRGVSAASAAGTDSLSSLASYPNADESLESIEESLRCLIAARDAEMECPNETAVAEGDGDGCNGVAAAGGKTSASSAGAADGRNMSSSRLLRIAAMARLAHALQQRYINASLAAAEHNRAVVGAVLKRLGAAPASATGVQKSADAAADNVCTSDAKPPLLSALAVFAGEGGNNNSFSPILSSSVIDGALLEASAALRHYDRLRFAASCSSSNFSTSSSQSLPSPPPCPSFSFHSTYGEYGGTLRRIAVRLALYGDDVAATAKRYAHSTASASITGAVMIPSLSRGGGGMLHTHPLFLSDGSSEEEQTDNSSESGEEGADGGGGEAAGLSPTTAASAAARGGAEAAVLNLMSKAKGQNAQKQNTTPFPFPPSQNRSQLPLASPLLLLPCARTFAAIAPRLAAIIGAMADEGLPALLSALTAHREQRRRRRANDDGDHRRSGFVVGDGGKEDGGPWFGNGGDDCDDDNAFMVAVPPAAAIPMPNSNDGLNGSPLVFTSAGEFFTRWQVATVATRAAAEGLSRFIADENFITSASHPPITKPMSDPTPNTFLEKEASSSAFAQLPALLGRFADGYAKYAAALEEAERSEVEEGEGVGVEEGCCHADAEGDGIANSGGLHSSAASSSFPSGAMLRRKRFALRRAAAQQLVSAEFVIGDGDGAPCGYTYADASNGVRRGAAACPSHADSGGGAGEGNHSMVRRFTYADALGLVHACESPCALWMAQFMTAPELTALAMAGDNVAVKG